MAFILKLEGDSELIKLAINSFALQHGWVLAENAEDQIDQPTFSAEVIKNFVKESVAAYNANIAAEQAREAAFNQTVAGVNALTITFSTTEDL